jgi:hypothetical protein
MQEGKKNVRKPLSLFGAVGDTFVVYFFELLDTRVKSFYFSGYQKGLAEKQAFEVTGKTLVSMDRIPTYTEIMKYR